MDISYIRFHHIGSIIILDVSCIIFDTQRDLGSGRTLAMLVLMSIHNLMKLDRLRPICSVKNFNGYKKGEQILRFTTISAWYPPNIHTNWMNWIFMIPRYYWDPAIVGFHVQSVHFRCESTWVISKWDCPKSFAAIFWMIDSSYKMTNSGLEIMTLLWVPW